MRPGARIAAAAGLLDQIIAGAPVAQVLTNWGRASRFAGSGDRAAVRDLVYDALRRRGSWGALGGGDTGRALMLGRLQEAGQDPGEVFTGKGHDLATLTSAETALGPIPDAHDLAILDWPDWLRGPVEQALRDRFAKVSAAMRDRAPVFLRVNPLKASVQQVLGLLTGAGVEANSVPDLPGAMVVTQGERRIASAGVLETGLAEMQDLSSQSVVAALPIMSGQVVLDYCAGGGGKSLAMAARVGPGGRVDAWDVNPRRMADLPERVNRAGAKVRRLQQVDPDQRYELVLCDAPCSGSGAWRRDPQGKWTLTRERLDALLQAQQQVLEGAAPHVAPDGVLAYATCSILPDENDRAVSRFLQTHPDWQVDATRHWLPEMGGGDGFFLAMMVRKAS